jgi:hypothetical protein
MAAVLCQKGVFELYALVPRRQRIEDAGELYALFYLSSQGVLCKIGGFIFKY